MKLNRYIKAALLAVVGLALASPFSDAKAQTILTNGYTNNFDIGANTDNFSGSGSVASWIYWYDFGGAVTNDISKDAGSNTTSGALSIYLPFTTGGNNALFFGTFGNGGGYDFSTRANLLVYSNITFDVLVDPAMPPFTNATTTNFGDLGVGMINANYGYQSFGSVIIPADATNHWVHLSMPINKTLDNLANAPGIVIDANNYSGYPRFPFHFWVDNVAANAPPAPPPPPPTLTLESTKPKAGLNLIGTSAANYQRYQIGTKAGSGFTFVGQPSVTYSWTVTQSPESTQWQQHIFFVNGIPGQYDQAADYNLAQCIFMTVTKAADGSAVFSLRYKTNQPGGNAMLFNTLALTNAANSNQWPVMPVVNLTNASGPLGTWSVTFQNTTNFTVHSPDGGTASYAFDPAAAALFADPMTVLVGGQPNTAGFGQTLVYSKFSISGNASPFTDDFVADNGVLDTNMWANNSNDTNGVRVVPQNAAYWLNWTLPDSGYSLQTTPNLPVVGNWNDLSSLGQIRNNGNRRVLLTSTDVGNTNHAYFELVKRSFTKLLVLLPGETLAPNTATGRTGTPTAWNSGDGAYTFAVYAVDDNFNRIGGITDSISVTLTDPNGLAGNNVNLNNGTANLQVLFGGASGPSGFTITATDATDGTKTANTSSAVVVN